jgi:hypothetical protein
MAAASLGNPQSNNLYAYVQNMPTDFVDPLGLRLAGPGTTYASGILWTWMHFRDGELVNWRQWFEPYPGGENSTGSAGASGESNSKKTDCEKFVDMLLGAVDKYGNNLTAAVNVGSNFLQDAKRLWDAGGKWNVSGFQERLIRNNQRSDVFRHVLAAAGSVLVEGGFLVLGDDLIRHPYQNWKEGGRRAGEHETAILNNSVGAAIGMNIRSHLAGNLTRGRLSEAMFNQLCETWKVAH